MADIQVNPTRMEMKKLQTRYITARRGHKLLKDKRDELMRQFLIVVREDKELRERVEARLAAAYGSFSVASAVSSPEMLREALIMPRKEGSLAVSYKNMMSVTVPVFDYKTGEESGAMNYGMAFTSGEIDLSVKELGEVMQELVRMAELEKTAQLLAEEIEKTRRRVNALEYIMMPRYLEGIKRIKMKLEENERGNLSRLMKVKDMMVEKTLSAKKNIAEEEE